MKQLIVTREEQRAIKSLQRLAKKWPAGIGLFSWSGSLIVTKFDMDNDRKFAVLDSIMGISNDGGDPGYGDEVYREEEIEFIYD